VLEKVSVYVEEHLGEVRGFAALLADPAAAQGRLVPEASPFACIAAEVLERLGGDYAGMIAGGDKEKEGLAGVARRAVKGSSSSRDLRQRREFVNSVGMKFVLIPAGTFLMGSPADEQGRYMDEGPQHEVQITLPFYLGVTPVTQ